jgi:hypothetical protein
MARTAITAAIPTMIPMQVKSERVLLRRIARIETLKIIQTFIVPYYTKILRLFRIAAYSSILREIPHAPISGQRISLPFALRLMF